jgi:hypothetical protein
MLGSSSDSVSGTIVPFAAESVSGTVGRAVFRYDTKPVPYSSISVVCYDENGVVIPCVLGVIVTADSAGPVPAAAAAGDSVSGTTGRTSDDPPK